VVVVCLRGQHRDQLGIGAALDALDRFGYLLQFAFAQ